MEANMFTRPEVKIALNRFVLARLFTDGDGDMYERQQAMQQTRYGTVALPFYAIVTPDGRAVVSFPGLTRRPEEFLAFLRRGAAGG
jgi:thiol:disulfide interchange protein DsbD